MSELVSIRHGLAKVSSDIKKGMYISAATSVRDAARAVLRIPMMKNELDEMVMLIKKGCELLAYKKEILQVFPLAITFKSGDEAALVGVLDELITTLQMESTDQALKEHEERKQAALQKGRKELTDGEHDEARTTFRDLTKEYDDDANLAVEVGETFMQHGLYEDASKYLGTAAVMIEDSAHVFNRLGIALRKGKKFSEAEKNFFRALELEADDPNLHFNLGRLYFDMQAWNKTLKSAEKALALNSDFTEARKMAEYAQRQIDAGN